MSLVTITKDRQRLILVGGLFVTILLSLRTLLYEPVSLFDFAWLGEFLTHTGQPENPLWGRDVVIFVVICLVWWRGISLAGRHIDIGDIGIRFRVTSLFLAILVGGVAESVLDQPATPFILLFFLSSLIAIVLTRIEQLELNQSGRSFPLGPRWVGMVALAAFLIVFIIGILSGVASGTAVERVMGWMGPLWTALAFLATAAMQVISYLSVPLILIFQWFLELLIALIGPLLKQAFDNLDLVTPTPVGGADSGGYPITSPTSTVVLPRQLITILSMTFIVLLVSLAFTRLLRFLRPPSEADTEFVNPLEGLSGKRPGFGRRLLDRLGLFRRWQAAASIRRIYQDMCTMAGSNGYPRLESETPYEYLKTLRQAWPENTAESLLITEAYNRIRYGELPETQAELDEIEGAWKRLEKILPDAGQTKNELEMYTRKSK